MYCVYLVVQVKVDRIERIQGKEYRALIISTVRTCASDFKQSKQEDIEDEIQSENGFLNNVKVHVLIQLYTSGFHTGILSGGGVGFIQEFHLEEGGNSRL